MKTALIAGHSGLIGEQLLKLLLEDNSYKKVISVGRRMLELSHSKLDQQIVDFNNINISTDTVDDVFCCLGTTMKVAGSKEKFRLVDFNYPVSLGSFCLTKGATSFSLVSSMGADKNSGIFYNKVKGEVEETIMQLGYRKVEIFRPSMLLGQRAESRMGESIGKVAMTLLSFLFVGPLENYKAIQREKVAKAMVHFAEEESIGTTIHLSGAMQKF